MLLRITGDHDFTLIHLMLALRTGKYLTLAKYVLTTPNESPSAPLLRMMRVGLLAFHQPERQTNLPLTSSLDHSAFTGVSPKRHRYEFFFRPP